MGRSSSNPTIRILMLGAAGVGKNCLESRFTTMTYPPPYDPALTLNSRRFFTLSPRPPTAQAPVTRPLDTSYGPNLRESKEVKERPHTASSTFSNPASEHRTPTRTEPSTDTGTAHLADHASSIDDATLVATASECCTECRRENNTYLVEVINYPTLQLPKVRAHVHAKAEYDAVLLVYDVASAASFELVKALHSEIPICTRKNHHHHHRRAAAHSGGARSLNRRNSGWFGGGANETGLTGSGEIVVGVVGNKSDFDAEYASIELGLDGPLLEKEAEIQGAEVQTRSLMHPLFRESQIIETLQLRDPRTGEPLSPTKVLSGIDAIAKDKDKESNADAHHRRSVMSADHALLDNRRSVLSKRSTRTLSYGGREKKLPKMPVRVDKTDVIERWLQTGKPPVEEDAAEAECTRIDSNESDPTMAARRQVSKLEGEGLVRELMLQVPFYETSAKTGENVEEVFEAMIREVLKEMGRACESVSKPCKHRVHHRYKKEEVKGERKPVVGAKGTTKEVDKETRVSTDIFSATNYDPKPLESSSKEVKVEEVVEEANEEGEDEGQPPPARKVRRRDSMMGAMRKVFMRKQPAMVTEAAA